MIYDALMRTVKSKTLVTTPLGTSDSDKWEVLLNGLKDQKVFPVVKRPGKLFMAYALVYTTGNDDYVTSGGAPLGAADNDKPVVFVMTQSTVR